MADGDKIDYQLLYENEKRLREVADRLREEADRLREEERHRREEAEQRHEEAEQRREEEQRRRKEAEQRRKEEQHRREDAEQRREEEQHRREDAEQRREEEQHRREEAEKRLEPTDFHSYLHFCHHELFLTLAMQKDTTRTSAPGLTKVDGKHYPLRFEVWDGFPSLHERCQRRLESTFGDEKRFHPMIGLEVVKGFLSEEPVADENDMRQFQFLAVEGCTKTVLQTYISVYKPEDGIRMPSGIGFSNNPYGLLSAGLDGSVESSDLPAYVPAMAVAYNDLLKNQDKPPANDDQSSTMQEAPVVRPRLYPDQWCLRADGVSKVPIFVVEHKAAHKLRVETIKKALDNVEEGLFCDVVRAVLSSTASQDEDVKEIVAAKRAMAHVIVQAFHYMVDFGLHYCYVTSGEALILLYVNADDPKTLYYHFAVPRGEVREGEDDSLRHTAVALVSTLALLALEAPQLTQKWKQDAQKALRKWNEWDTLYAEMDIRRGSSETGTEDSQNNPAQGCHEPVKGRRKDDKDSGDDDFQLPSRKRKLSTALLSPPPTRSTRSSSANSRAASTDRNSTQQSVLTKAYRWTPPKMPAEYCTQACLTSLRDGGLLDPQCPNVLFHRRGGTSLSHAITLGSFVSRMRQQLADDLDRDCEALDKYGKFGAIGVLFRLTLRGYRYCVVAKGVQEPHLARLQGEERVYCHLQEQQGELVPVFLGILRLEHEYWTSSGAHISHMMLMSYCGEPTYRRDLVMPGDIQQMIGQLWKRLQELGVRHGDERAPNVVWNASLQRPMCIDFDWAQIQDDRVPLKRKRSCGT